VDNTPEPEPEDVQAHLIGGIPESEVAARELDFSKFGLASEALFQPERPKYLTFKDSVEDKSEINTVIEADPKVTQTLSTHREALGQWWHVARDEFARLERVNNGNGSGRKMPYVRHELLTTLKKKLVPLRVLDEFKSAGVFVNWWQQIRFDLKTIVSTGWHHTLIPDEYLIVEFFQVEADAIEALVASTGELQSELAEAVETAQEVAAFEPDEEQKVTAAVIKKALKVLIDDLKGSTGASAKRELDQLKKQDATIKNLEKKIKETKAKLKKKTTELELKIELKRLGGEGFAAENNELIRQAEAQLAKLSAGNRADKKKITTLENDKAALEARIAQTDTLLAEIDGQLTDDEAKRLILKKLYDIASAELERYLNAEKRLLIQSVENLWNKYAISRRELEQQREKTLGQLNGFLEGLGYC
ncbi:MAG: N-6 DNA methylase, partial [Deltaproteobacteria bacterium]|nr:N-6 DNA methylase [Deltaproteobacteria bacterium]